MRGRKTPIFYVSFRLAILIKKESPNEGTETVLIGIKSDVAENSIKKESPNEGTETIPRIMHSISCSMNKKRIPE